MLLPDAALPELANGSPKWVSMMTTPSRLTQIALSRLNSAEILIRKRIHLRDPSNCRLVRGDRSVMKETKCETRRMLEGLELIGFGKRGASGPQATARRRVFAKIGDDPKPKEEAPPRLK